MADRQDSGQVALVSVSYGSADELTGLLDSLPAAAARPVEVVIADNFPQDASAREVARAYGATYVPLGNNPGYGAAVNAAVSTLPGSVSWLVVANPDLTFDAGAIDLLIATAETDESIAAVGPAILNLDRSVYPSARAVPSLRTGIGHALFANIWPENPWTRAYKQSPDDEPAQRDAGWLSGSCLLVRRSAFERLGGFDSGYFMYFEDVDLGYRIGLAGMRNVYLPTASVVHSGAHSTGEHSVRMVQAHHESARRFIGKKYSGPLLLPVRTVLYAGLALRSRLLRNQVRH